MKHENENERVGIWDADRVASSNTFPSLAEVSQDNLL
jgi:hypothetical protein